MNNSRRNFLKLTGLASLAGGTGLFSGRSKNKTSFSQPRQQQFNMHGYAAPKLDSIGVGVIGLGNRGSGTILRFASIEGVEIKAICDLEPDRVSKAKGALKDFNQDPVGYSGGKNEWKKLCERDDLDLICIVTPWHLHTIQSVYAMEQEKHVFVELPAANTIEECWQLVETSERTRRHCVQMSDSCHFGSPAVVLKMVRSGVFGEIIHGEGAYIHDLMNDYNFTKNMYHNMWRLNENIGRHGNLYPQHGLVPVCQMMDINYGDQMDYLVSMQSDDFMMGKRAKELAANDDFWEPYVGRDYRGNINTTTIRTNKGRTIVVQHDVTTPRPAVRFDLISGTVGTYQAKPDRIGFNYRDGWIPEEDVNSMMKKYMPNITKRFNDLVKEAQSARQGRSYARVSATDWRLIDCLRNGLPVEMDVYDAAVSSAVIPLSEWSVANRSNSVDVPDFTKGAWKTNEPGMDVDLNEGGNTKLV
ncbi:MAG: Gfo/Idh/MocA family oxidoreductase [Balneolales bacterium]